MYWVWNVSLIYMWNLVSTIFSIIYIESMLFAVIECFHSDFVVFQIRDWQWNKETVGSLFRFETRIQKCWFLFHCFETKIQKFWFLFHCFETRVWKTWFLFHCFETKIQKCWFLFHCFETETRKSWFLFHVSKKETRKMKQRGWSRVFFGELT